MTSKSRTPLTLSKTVLRPLTSTELKLVAGGSGATSTCYSKTTNPAPSTHSCPHS